MYVDLHTRADKWPWSRSLALAPEGETVQVEAILFGAVQDRCWELGIRRGSILTCRGHREDGDVWIGLPSGKGARIPRHYAWFVEVAPL